MIKHHCEFLITQNFQFLRNKKKRTMRHPLGTLAKWNYIRWKESG